MSAPISKIPAVVAKSGVSFDVGLVSRIRLDGGTPEARKFIVSKLAELWNAQHQEPRTLRLAELIVRAIELKDVRTHDVTDSGAEVADYVIAVEPLVWAKIAALAQEIVRTAREGSR